MSEKPLTEPQRLPLTEEQILEVIAEKSYWVFNRKIKEAGFATYLWDDLPKHQKDAYRAMINRAIGLAQDL